MASWHSTPVHRAPFSDWYSQPSKREMRQEKRMASIEKQLQALLKGASSVTPLQKSSSQKHIANAGACPEQPASDTVWICSFCDCPHNNPKKVVCRWCGRRRTTTSGSSTVGLSAPATDIPSVSVSASVPPVVLPAITPGPVDKPWMKRILSSAPSVAEPSAPTDLTSTPTAPVDASLEKRRQLEKVLADAKTSGCGEDLLKLIQKELDALPTPQVGGQLQEAGRLYQEKGKQEKHYSSQIAALDKQFENLDKQRQQLDELGKQLREQRTQLEAQHTLNMERIDAAINARVSTSPGAPLGTSSSLSLASSLVSQAHSFPFTSRATTAQVLSETLGTAVNDSSFFSNVPPEHQMAIKSFCAQVTAHFAADNPSMPASVSDRLASLPESLASSDSPMAIDPTSMSVPDDMNPHNFVGSIN